MERTEGARCAGVGAVATSDRPLWRRLFTFPVVLNAGLAYLVFILARRNIPDPDLWWHLRDAQFLLTHHQLPTADVYSYTASGAHVLPFEWLAGLFLYAAHSWAGLTGCFWLVFAVCTAIVLGVFRLSYLASGDVKNSFIFSVAGAGLATINIGARTILFGWLYLVTLLLILAAFRQGNSKWLALVPPLFCVWINTHGSWPMGIVLFGIFAGSGIVEGIWGNAYARRWTPAQLWKLSLTAGASVAALFINPFGFELVAYPFRVLFAHSSGSGAGASGLASIQEFMSINFQTAWGKVAMLLILGLLLVAIFSRERWRLDEIGFTMVALYYCLTYSRFLFLAGILLPPVFAKRVKLMMPYEQETDRPLPNALALALLLSLFVITVPRKFEPVVPYPEGAVTYMEAHGIRSHVFHEWVWGGYLMWHMPELKVFIDGRGDPYGANGVFHDYMSAIRGVNPEAVLAKYKVQYVLMRPSGGLAQSLQGNPAWTVLYSDKDSVLLGRSASANP